VSGGGSDTPAANALRENIATKGKNAYYYAHAREADAPVVRRWTHSRAPFQGTHCGHAPPLTPLLLHDAHTRHLVGRLRSAAPPRASGVRQRCRVFGGPGREKNRQVFVGRRNGQSTKQRSRPFAMMLVIPLSTCDSPYCPCVALLVCAAGPATHAPTPSPQCGASG
jgi:hypothetical protein